MSAANLSVSERRWQEGRGERYLASDPTRVRCQGVSKSRLRQARITSGNPELSSDDVWPELQCTQGAEEGTFLCKYHGGKSITIQKRSLMEFMPIDLQRKFQVFADNPDLMNRAIEIAALQARNAELFERMEDLEIGEEAYRMVLKGVEIVEQGSTEIGTGIIRQALHNVRTEHEIWEEVRTNASVIDKLTRTQIGLEKDYSMMTSLDQVKSIVETLFLSVLRVINTYVKEESTKQLMIAEIASTIRNRTNMKAPMVVESAAE